MRRLLASILLFAACTPPTDPTATGLTLSAATPQRLTGAYRDDQGNLLRFDSAKVGDELFFELSGNGDRPLIRIETRGDDYDFSYLGGVLKMHTTKAFVAEARAQAETTPDGVSTDGFIFDGDTNALDAMMRLPELAMLPHLSRALGERGVTGSQVPASLALHKVARQTAEGLGIQVEPLVVASTEGYCTAYPNRSNSCYGMCGSGCSCWSWVCGDCCYHGGCATHDSWCRQGKWYYCYNISAVVALFGC